jgi:hypothetical protein
MQKRYQPLKTAMPTLVHIADERDTKRIVNNGLKIGKHRRGIFFMPVTQDYYISHQWLRELKRRGIRTFVGVYFKLKSNEIVWFGKYHEGHTRMELGKALAQFMKADDKLGFEFLIERKIDVTEIDKIKHLHQTVGWRYTPDSHKRALTCACPMCISPGEINSRKKREKIEPVVRIPGLREIIERLRFETDESEVDRLFSFIRRKKRRTDPEELRFIIENGNISAIRSLALSLEFFRHPTALTILTELCQSSDEEVREFSAYGILKIDRDKGIRILKRCFDDKTISKFMEDI